MKKLYAINYKTGGILQYFVLSNNSDFIAFYGINVCMKDTKDFLNNVAAQIPFNGVWQRSNVEQLDPIMQKVVEKTGCMVFGDYVVSNTNGDIYFNIDIENAGTQGNIFDELLKHHTGENNRLEEFLS